MIETLLGPPQQHFSSWCEMQQPMHHLELLKHIIVKIHSCFPQFVASASRLLRSCLSQCQHTSPSCQSRCASSPGSLSGLYALLKQQALSYWLWPLQSSVRPEAVLRLYKPDSMRLHKCAHELTLPPGCQSGPSCRTAEPLTLYACKVVLVEKVGRQPADRM